jgi:predicted O-methyltransferase YrrM
MTVAGMVKREAIRPKYGTLLFRLANYFKPQNILQIGSSPGLSTLYLTSYTAGLKCISLERVPEFASVAGQVYSRAARTSIDLRVGDYGELLPGILREMGTVDFLFLNCRRGQEDARGLFTACLPCLKEDSVVVCEGIRSDKSMRRFWKDVCAHPEVTVALDLFSIGIILFRKKLHKKKYIVFY